MADHWVRLRGLKLLSGLALAGALLVAGCGVPLHVADPLPPAERPPATAGPTPDETEPSATPAPTTSPASPTPEPTPTPTLKPSATKPPARPILSEGDSGAKVKELQARLKQLDWFADSITGTYGKVTARGVKGFQGKRKLTATGAVDQRTWETLIGMTRTPTEAELSNRPALLSRGDSGRKVKELQARLKQLDHFDESITGSYGPVTTAAVRDFQRDRGLGVTGAVDQQTWDALVGRTRKPTAAELADAVPSSSTAGLDERCLTGRAVCISKRTNKLVWLINGTPKLRMDVRFGSDELPTREGTFSVLRKKKDVISNIYHTPMPYSMFFSGGQAVHYSADFAARGYNGASHGCVNVRNWDAIVALYAQTRVGDKVIVYS
ncbi:L,D-transpeptidase family protein [Microlunatus speluncae]|uniref:L,D-transpeptidase family protein n=1 Tax=Microlunatus speluncae TaxID=2594267 RepID=UPI0012666CBA|nr:peptidoglycan-binding protein [Microlunatus speluncae]